MEDSVQFKIFLIEGSIHLIERFNVAQNKRSYRATMHRHIIYINKWIGVQQVDDPHSDIPFLKFNFIDFDGLPARNLNDLYLTGTC